MAEIDAFLDAVGVAFAHAGEIVPWPMHVAQVGPFYEDLEASDLVRLYTDLRSAGVTDADLAGLYPSASSAKSLMLDLVPGMKAAKVSRDVRVEVATSLLRGLAERETGDVFCRDGGHRLLTPDAAQALAEGDGWTPVNGSVESAQAAFRLSGAAQALVWSMHFYGWTDIAFVIHGPYPVTGPDGTPQVLVVRDFFDISPGELWPELPEPPCRTIRCLSAHDASDTFRIDIFNHLLHDRPLLESTRAVRVMIDDADVAGSGSVSALRTDLVRLVRRQKAVIDGMTEQEVMAKFIESRYYAFRHWRVRAGDSWRPPAEVYTRIAERPLPPAPPAGEAAWGLLRDIFDPRCELPD
ncbi:hypothetical protein [Micromonospora sp. NPDC049662]|uniref:hypothetical protein n=1 Tax=Micromonospora sp. NPDC049662 TaxID=3155397 RepID=UPI003445FB1A